MSHNRMCSLNHVTLEFLPLGLDYNAGVYRAVSEQGTGCLLKATSDERTR